MLERRGREGRRRPRSWPLPQSLMEELMVHCSFSGVPQPPTPPVTRSGPSPGSEVKCMSTLLCVCHLPAHLPAHLPTCPPTCLFVWRLVRDEVNHVESHEALVPHIQVSVLRAVGEHGQDSTWSPEVKGHVDWLPLKQVEGEGDPGVFSVSDVEDAAGDEGVAGLGVGVAGVDVGGDGEGLLVQLSHHDALVHAGGEDQPQAVLVHSQLEVGEAVVQGVVDGERLELPGAEVKPVNGRVSLC
ncbi:hypothetical protein INR49_008066 [Caranx melampygus]|nr:hypothetical protein INR49_008066 [Caranx melampygus]